MNSRNSMTKVVRFWLLDTAVELERHLCLLYPEVRGEALNMRPIPGLQPAEYVEYLIQLAVEGSVQIYRWTDETDPERIPLDPADVRRAVSDGVVDQIGYCLTAKGGAEWEALACPRWEECVATLDDAVTGEAYSINLDRLIGYVGWWPKLFRCRIATTKMTLTRHEKYPIFYWKTLPDVYMISFQFEEGEELPYFRHPDWLERWALNGWYTHPWQHPEWPRTGGAR